MFSSGIPHTPFAGKSAWIHHYYDTSDANQRHQIHAANVADEQGHDALARHIMGARPGENPFATYRGPFGEGKAGKQFSPTLPSQLYSEYFGGYTPPGGTPGQGPFADPRKFTPPRAAGPQVVTGDAYQLRNAMLGGGGGP